MICTKCHKDNPNTNKVCYFCNTPLSQITNTQPYDTSQVQPQFNMSYNQNQNTNTNPKIKTIACPGCGTQIPASCKKCVHCKTVIPERVPLVQCAACGNMISRQADNCPYCGHPRRKVVNPVVLDAFAVLAIAIAIFAYVGGAWVFSYGVMLACLIIYWIYYGCIEDNPDLDCSKVKHSLTIITVLFVLMFCISFVFTIRFI